MKVKGSLVKLILFAAVTLFATSILALTIANIQLGSKATYTAVVSDATGVVDGQDVRIAGVRVGEVTDVRVAPDSGSDRASAEIEFQVLKSSVLTQGTEVTVKYRNLVGQRYLALTQGAGRSSLARRRLDDPALAHPPGTRPHGPVQRLQAALRRPLAERRQRALGPAHPDASG